MTTSSLLLGLLPAAIGFALSPAGIIELILVVFSRRARINGIVFLVTVAIPTFVIPMLGATVVKSATTDAGGSSGSAGVWVQLVFGVLLLLLAAASLRRYRDTEAPKVFAKIEGMGPIAVATLAIGVTLFNPKNLALLLTAGETMREATLSTTGMLVTVGLFTLVAMSPFLLVVGYQRFGGPTAAERLERLKTALMRNNHKIMFWLTSLLGIVFLAQALPALLA